MKFCHKMTNKLAKEKLTRDKEDLGKFDNFTLKTFVPGYILNYYYEFRNAVWIFHYAD